MFNKLEQPKVIENLMAAYPVLKARPESNGRIGAAGLRTLDFFELHLRG